MPSIKFNTIQLDRKRAAWRSLIVVTYAKIPLRSTKKPVLCNAKMFYLALYIWPSGPFSVSLTQLWFSEIHWEMNRNTCSL